MKPLLVILARRLWPDFDALAELDRAQLLYDLYGTVFSIPWLVVVFIWLPLVTDLAVLRAEWLLFCLFLAFSITFGRLSFFQITRLGGEKYSYNSSDLSDIALIPALLVFGPTAVWLRVMDVLIQYISRWNRAASHRQRMSWARNLAYNLSIGIMNALILLFVYQWLGGSFPLAAIRFPDLLPAFGALLVAWVLNIVFMLFLWFSAYWQAMSTYAFLEDYWSVIRQNIWFFTVAQLPGAYGILAAAIYTQMGLIAFIFFLSAGLLISLMARQLSQAVILSDQKSGELDQLEQLGRAIIASPPDASLLPNLLSKYVPNMLAYHQIEIRLASNHILLRLPEDRSPVEESVWQWLENDPRFQEFNFGDVLPWSNQKSVNRLVIVPITSADQNFLGGICLVEGSTFMGDISTDIQPALQVLAAQISSALHSAEVFAQTIEHERVAQELALGGQIQASFLPETLPDIDRWHLAATLIPAKETSGDFYDVIPLSNGCFAFVVADVADKGVGAALFMALSRTLIRSYAMQFEADPEQVLAAVNNRILSDARADLFVTAFYGVLNPSSGEFTYANAGHNPPCLISENSEKPISMLEKTGMALGLLEESRWEKKSIKFQSGDTLVMYSDGITDAQNSESEFFGEDRLLSVIQSGLEKNALDIQGEISSAVAAFVDEEPQFDDITLVIIKRET